MTAVNTLMERLEFTVAEPVLDLVDGYASAMVEVSLDGAELCQSRVYWTIGFLAAGASQDIDGSGLSLWGSSQPGGWRAVHGGSGEDGRDGRLETGAAVAGALVARGELAEEDVNDVVDEVRGWYFGELVEPTADEVWEALESGRSRDDDQWRVGRLCGLNTPLLAWVDEDGDRRHTWSPDPWGVEQAAMGAKARIQAALDALQEVTP